MIKLAITCTILLATFFTPVFPSPATLHFAPNTPIEQALALTDHLAGQQITTTFIDPETSQRLYSARLWDNRHPSSYATRYHPGETVNKIHLTQLSTTDANQLQANPLIQNIEYIPSYLVNPLFFYRWLLTMLGPH